MKVYLKALLKCKAPVKINNAWLKPYVWCIKLGLGHAYGNWWVRSRTAHDEWDKSMKSKARIFIAYDGALECPGRDTDEFIHMVARGMDETIQYWSGVVAPRVQIEMCFADPEQFPYHYVKWTTLINIFNLKKYLTKNKFWLTTSVILISTNTISIIQGL